MRRFLMPCALFIAALLPRIFTLGRALTTDEAYHWLDRSVAFLAAIGQQRWADTALTGHPGVTTMWLGSIGLLLERGLQALGWLGADVPFETHLALLRAPLAVATALAVPAGYALMRRFLPTPAALLAALLWASDPFLVAHSRVLHLDALVSLLMALALLALLAACFDSAGPLERPSSGLALLAGAFSGLALVTKAPGVLALPIGALALALWALQLAWRRAQPRSLRGLLAALPVRGVLLIGALWLAGTLLAAFISWPALWVTPGPAIMSVVNEVINNGGEPMNAGNFLLGQSEKDPGLLYYAVTLFGRSTPWTILGLLAFTIGGWRSARGHSRTPALLLAFGALLLVLTLSFVAKKADRYAMPAVPLLLVVAGCGLATLGAWLPALPRRALAGLGAAAAIGTLAWLHPYEMAYFSPLIGGSASAPQLVPIGWGEGLDAVADWINAQPDAQAGAVATWSPPTLAAYLRGKSTWQGDLIGDNVRYLVVYINQAQSGKENQYFDRYYPGCPPAHIVRLKGIDYAWIYRLQQPQAQSTPVRFADVMEISKIVTQPPDPCTNPQNFALTLDLVPHTRPAEPQQLFLHLIGPQGQQLSQLDIPLSALIPDDHWKGAPTLEHTLNMKLPPNAPSGAYTIVAGLYNPSTGARAPIQTSAAAIAHPDGAGAVGLSQIAVDAEALAGPAAALKSIPIASWLTPTPTPQK